MLINDILDRFSNINKLFSASLFSLGRTFKYNDLTDQDALKYGYMSNLDYYSIVTKAASGVKNLPIKLYEVDARGEYIEVTQGEVHDYIFNPNDDQTLGELFEQEVIYRLVNGESFFYAPRPSLGFIDGNIYAVPPQAVTVVLESKSLFSPVKGYIIDNCGTQIKATPDEMLHVRMTNPSLDGMEKRNGLSPLQAGQYKLKGSNNNAEAAAWYFENRGVSNIISGENPATGIALTPRDKAALEAANMDIFGGASKMNRIITTKGPVTVNQLGSSPSDLQMLERDKQYLRDLCNLIFMPSELFNDPENKTHANRREAVKTLYYDVLIPNCEALLHGYRRKFLADWSKRNNKRYDLQVDVSEIHALQPTPMEKREQIRADVNAGIISRNEAREEQGWTPLNIPEMDIPTIQSSEKPVNQVEENN